MDSYLYPTEDKWFAPLLETWKHSGQPKLIFPFFNFKVTTLPQNTEKPYWVYLYYSKSRTDDEALRGVVQYRVRVIRHSFEPITDAGAHARDYEPTNGDKAAVYFLCDLVEEITNSAGEALRLADFVHRDGVKLSSAIYNSIAPIRRIMPMVTVQTTSYNPQD